MATYGPGIDQSQHAKSVSHIIISFIIVTVLFRPPFKPAFAELDPPG